ncbi:MAG: tetratricopeptide repeat protein [Proteobacteria bacterium]|nr:tetratricopeptide repeat protein [Pseudomonadota bacterium]
MTRRLLPLLVCAALTVSAAARAATVEELRKAADGYRAQLAANPNLPDVQAALGETLESLGDINGALAAYDRGAKGGSDRALVDRGRLFVRQGRFADGRDDFNRALSHNSRNVEALAARGHSWVAEGKSKRAKAAQADLDAALEIDPNNPTALNARGDFYLAELKPELAIADFDKALKVNPKDDVVLFNRGVAWKQMNHYDRALRDFNAALRVTPGDPMTLAAKGDTYRELGDLLLARDFYDAALKLEPRNARVLEARGEVRVTLGDGPGGEADKAQAHKLDPNVEASS